MEIKNSNKTLNQKTNLSKTYNRPPELLARREYSKCAVSNFTCGNSPPVSKQLSAVASKKTNG